MKSLCLITLLLLIQFAGLAANQLDVGPGKPFANIAPAMKAAKPGDTILIHSGTYETYQLVENIAGVEDNWFVIKKAPNATITIQGFWQFSKVKYIRFEDLDFKAGTKFPGRVIIIDNGGDCATQCTRIEFFNCTFMNSVGTEDAIFKFAGVDNFSIKNCLFKDLSGGAFDINTCRNGVIEANRIENCLTGGHIKGGGYNIYMVRNTFINASRSPWAVFELGGDTSPEFYCSGDSAEVSNLYFYSNLVIGGHHGIALSSAVLSEIVNNTFYKQNGATLRFLTTSKLFPALKNNIVANNIFCFGEKSKYMNGSAQLSGSVSFITNIFASTDADNFSGPYWDTPALDAIKNQDGLVLGKNTQIFSDPTKNDFRLSKNSPAITGATFRSNYSNFDNDFLGSPFLFPKSFGAYQYVSDSIPSAIDNVASEINSSGFLVFPNPTREVLELYGTLPESDFTNLSVEIINTVGQVLVRQVIQGEIPTLNLQNIPAGTYICRIVALGSAGTQTKQCSFVKL